MNLTEIAKDCGLVFRDYKIMDCILKNGSGL